MTSATVEAVVSQGTALPGTGLVLSVRDNQVDVMRPNL